MTLYATPDGSLTQPLVYSITKLIIEKKQQPAAEAVEAAQEAITPQQLMLDAEIKDAHNFYRQDGWINLSAMQDGHAVLLVFEQPSQDPIIPASNYAPIDILMIDEQGKISEIVPSLILANLEQDIYPSRPVKAFMLLSSGSTAALGIKPGDEIIYSIFKKPPPVITESTPVPPAEPNIPTRAITKIPDGSVPIKPNLKERRTPESQPSKPR